jgi:hypothetical protein
VISVDNAVLNEVSVKLLEDISVDKAVLNESTPSDDPLDDNIAVSNDVSAVDLVDISVDIADDSDDV